MTALVTVICLAAFALGYRYYARYVGRRVLDDGDDFETPAHAMADGKDYVATNKHVLFGHHFTSVAGAAPIIGPCVAAYWGWLPALLWVVLGTIFMGAVHDYAALDASVRSRGHSIAHLAGTVMGKRARLMFLCFVLLLVWLVLAVFAMAIAGLFVSQPAAVLPIHIEIVVAVLIGWAITKRRMALLWPSIGALITLYFFVWLGTLVPIELGPALEHLGLGALGAERAWIISLFFYSAVASMAPVWLLLQPRDYINSHQLMVGLALLFAGLFVAHPDFDAPALRISGDDAPSIFPLLFVTIACGAISGFHGLVSSGTTAKQLDRAADARFVGYGGMLGEGTLALASTMAAVAGVALVGSCTLKAQGLVPDLSWAVYYDSWAHAGTNAAQAFVLGGGAFLAALGMPSGLAQTVMAVLVISFAATTLDTATRIQRFIIAELGQGLGLRALERPLVGTALAVLPAMILAFWEIPDPATGQARQVGWVLWPIFGASNQMLAALTLMVLALYYAAKKRPVWPLIIPMILTMLVTLLALIGKARDFIDAHNWPMAGVAFVLLAMVVWMIFEGAAAFSRRKRGATP